MQAKNVVMLVWRKSPTETAVVATETKYGVDFNEYGLFEAFWRTSECYLPGGRRPFVGRQYRFSGGRKFGFWSPQGFEPPGRGLRGLRVSRSSMSSKPILSPVMSQDIGDSSGGLGGDTSAPKLPGLSGVVFSPCTATDGNMAQLWLVGLRAVTTSTFICANELAGRPRWTAGVLGGGNRRSIEESPDFAEQGDC